MVIKEITENRKKIFLENLQKIYNAMTELSEIGVSNKEVSRFLQGVVNGKVIFKGKFYYDHAKKRFVHKSNYPKYFEYFEHYIHLAEKRDERLSVEKDEKINNSSKRNEESINFEKKGEKDESETINEETVNGKKKTNRNT